MRTLKRVRRQAVDCRVLSPAKALPGFGCRSSCVRAINSSTRRPIASVFCKQQQHSLLSYLFTATITPIDMPGSTRITGSRHEFRHSASHNLRAFISVAITIASHNNTQSVLFDNNNNT